jgi:hypothetical protein
MKFVWIVPFIFLIACMHKEQATNQYTAVLEKGDTLHIWYKFKDRISAVHKGDRRLFNWVNEVFNGKEESCTCEADGGIHVYLKDSVLLDVEFATAVNDKDCKFLIIKEERKKDKCYPLSHQLGTYLSEMREFIKPD